MKKTLAILCALLMMTAAFAGCTDRTQQDESLDESQVIVDDEEDDAETRPSLAEAAANNAQIDANTIDLVQFAQPGPDDQVAVMKTTMGDIVFALYPGEAPLAVENFITLANDGFYNGKVFHFVQEGFLVQGGAVNSNGTGSKSSFTDSDGDQALFEVEPSWNMWHFRGALSMVSNSDNLNGSQFVIIQSDNIYQYEAKDLEEAKFPQKVIDKYAEIGGVPHMDAYDSVFGMVISGMDVVDQMVAADKDVSGMPTDTILIESVTIGKFSDVQIAEQAAA